MNVVARCVAVLICLGQLSLQAALRWPDAPVQEVAEPVLRLGSPKEVSVIVELAAPPLLESRKRGDVRTASETLESLFGQLSADIDRIERRTSSSATANATGSSLRFQYRMAFAGASVRVSRDALPAVRALPYVKAVHADTTMEAYLDSSVPHIGVPQVWEQYGLKGRGIVIAIIDTGVDYTHWALGQGFGPGRRVVGGYDFVNNDADPMDDHGHGTHVAGIAAGNPPLKGVAPEATLLAYKVLNSEGTGQVSAILAAIDRTMDPDGNGDPSDRADVVNMSLGGPLSRNDAVVAAVERSVAAGTVFCLAAGNSFGHGTIGSPGAAPSAITVGATKLDDEPTDFTSRGPIGGSWLVKPEIAAPGLEIASAFPGGVTRVASGTSMAAPHVSGVAALVLEQHPDWTPEDVKAAIVSTAKPALDRSTGTPLPSITSAGAGRIDALRAVETTILPSPSTITFGHLPKRGQAYSTSRTVRFANRGGASEKLTVRPPPLPGGITLTATPASVTVEAGATVEIGFRLDLTADALPPNEGNVVVAGILEVAGATSVLRLPWQIMNGDAVSATYAGTDDFQVYVSEGMSPAAMWWEGPRTFGAFVLKTRDADLLVLSSGQEEEAAGRLIIRERVRVEGPTAVTITPDEAVHRITVAGVSETGVPLATLGDGRKAWHYIKLPSLGFVTVEYPERLRSLLVSPLDRTEMRTYENAFTGSSRYFGAYRNLRGLKQSETLSIVPADWGSQRVRLRCNTDCTVLAASGGGSPLFWDYEAMPAAEDEWTIHVTPQVLPEIDFRVHFIVREKDFVLGDRSINPWTYMSPSIRNTNGRVAASTFNRATEGDYLPPDRYTPMEFGDGPVVLRMTMGSRRVDLRPHGPLGESLGSNALKIQAKLTKADGSNMSMVRDLFAGTFEFQPPPDTYRFTATDTYTVNGKPGKLTQVSLYDTRLYDAPPGLSMLRIETERGSNGSLVAQHSRPRLVFAARTSLFVPPNNFYISHTPVIASATKAWWRPHGTSEWQPLAVTMTGDDSRLGAGEQPGPPGTLFAAPLDAATAGTGEIDLKILVGNEYGATTETVYEPALIVVPTDIRRRAARK